MGAYEVFARRDEPKKYDIEVLDGVSTSPYGFLEVIGIKTHPDDTVTIFWKKDDWFHQVRFGSDATPKVDLTKNHIDSERETFRRDANDEHIRIADTILNFFIMALDKNALYWAEENVTRIDPPTITRLCIQQARSSMRV